MARRDSARLGSQKSLTELPDHNLCTPRLGIELNTRPLSHVERRFVSINLEILLAPIFYPGRQLQIW
jgi:hypothetical protein